MLMMPKNSITRNMFANTAGMIVANIVIHIVSLERETIISIKQVITRGLVFPAKILQSQLTNPVNSFHSNAVVGIRILAIKQDNILIYNDPSTPLLRVPVSATDIRHHVLAGQIGADNHRAIHHFDGAHTIAALVIPAHTAIPVIDIIGSRSIVEGMDRQMKGATYTLLVQNLRMRNAERFKIGSHIKQFSDTTDRTHNLLTDSETHLATHDDSTTAIIFNTNTAINQSIRIEQVHNAVNELSIGIAGSASPRLTPIRVESSTELFSNMLKEPIMLTLNFFHFAKHFIISPLIGERLRQDQFAAKQFIQIFFFCGTPKSQQMRSILTAFAISIARLFLSVLMELRHIIHFEHSQHPFFHLTYIL